MSLIKNRFFRIFVCLGILFSILVSRSDTQARGKIVQWEDSHENLDNVCEDIADILLYQITDWDFQIHTGDLTSGG